MSTDKLILGRLGAPRGIKGDLKLQSYSGEFDHIVRQKSLELHGEGRVLVLKVIRYQINPDVSTIAFEGYPTPETARVLTGMEIHAPREAAAPLGKNEWYVVDLVGCVLKGPKGSPLENEELATVISVVEGGPDPWLEVSLPAGSKPDSGKPEGGKPEGGKNEAAKPELRKALVPFRKEFVGEVDIKRRSIELLATEILE